MHCKDVSVCEVEFPLTAECISSEMEKRNAYTRTEYMILRNGIDCAVVRIIEKENSSGLFKKVLKYEIVAMPDDIDCEEIPDLDVLNVPALAKVQLRHPNKGVVITGMFSHVVFIMGLEPVYLHVVDNVPPSPAKLSVLVKKALDTGYVEYPIVPVEHIIDMEEKIKEATNKDIVFPCKVSGLKGRGNTYYLDCAPELDGDVTLIGCNLSKRIFESLYGRTTEFINVCPADFASGYGKCIVKCCKVKNGFSIEGDIVQVPWGATVPEVVNAINNLFRDCLKQ